MLNTDLQLNKWNADMNTMINVVIFVMLMLTTLASPDRSENVNQNGGNFEHSTADGLTNTVSFTEGTLLEENSTRTPFQEEPTKGTANLKEAISADISEKVSNRTTSDDAQALSTQETNPNKIKTIVKCECQGSEVIDDVKCRPYEGIVVPVRHYERFSKLENISNFKVVVHNINCDSKTYKVQNFPEGQFHFRIERGNVRDVLLTDGAGKLEGQRINKYCLSHYLNNNLDLTWTLKACIPIPFVPRCCHYGHAMKNGTCQAANTPKQLTPPIVIKPSTRNFVEWPNLGNSYNNLICKSETMRTIPLGNNGSHLLLLANGLSLTWIPTNNYDGYFKEYYSPDYCVDGIENSEDIVDYFVSFCFTSRKEKHDQSCGKRPCIRKCCGDGHSYSNIKRRCLPDPNSTLSLLDVSELLSYNVVYDFPLCWDFTEVKEEKIKLDINGQLILHERNYTSTDYCLDTFFNKSHTKLRALTCKGYNLSWERVRIYVILVFKFISIIFLTISIVFHIQVPKLLAHGGVHQLCHIIALTIAFVMGFSLNVFRNYTYKNYSLCVGIAIVMQYGFLATMFWLNVICVEVWRKLRKLAKFQASKKYPEYVFLLYGWGSPSLICIVTIIMQFANPHRVGSEIRPYIGTAKICWFPGDLQKFLYFYLHFGILSLFNTVLIVHAYYNIKIILRNSTENSKDLRSIGRSSQKMSDHVMDFHQKFKLFALSVICWITEVLSWKITPIEIWILTDIINALQGLGIFIILMTNSNKRKLLEKRYPLTFILARRFFNGLCKCRKGNADGNRQTTNAVESVISDSISLSTIISHLSYSSSDQ